MRCILWCALSLVGCATTRALPIDGAPALRPTCPAAVLLFASAKRVPAAYEELAILKAEGHGDSVMFRSMRRRAAALGANGLIYRPPDPGWGELEGTAIHIPSDTTRVAQQCTDADRAAAAADSASPVPVRLPGAP